MEDKYFKPAGDLLYSKKIDSKLTPFRNPGDIEHTYFKSAGDLEDTPVMGKSDINKNNQTFINNYENNMKVTNNYNEAELSDYLLTVVSGKKYDSVCELGVLMGAGRMVVDLEQLKRMVDEGHNIIRANVINAERGLIEIEFQRYEYDEEKIERWRRF